MRVRKAFQRRGGGQRSSRGKYRFRDGSESAGQAEAVRQVLRGSGAQAKLTVGRPDDAYEKEADKMAEKVTSMPDAALQRVSDKQDEEQLQAKPLAGQITPLLQRKDDAPEEEQEEPVQSKRIQRQAGDEEEQTVQAKAAIERPQPVSSGTESGINCMRSGGRPLDAPTRRYFEPRFGRGFGDVRVHTDGRAAETARSLNARAFTLGNDVVFGAGEYAPHSMKGRRLLAHELTHTVQQKGRAGGAVQAAADPRHDLTSRLFSGDATLQAVYDNHRTLKCGSSGEAVKKVQRALIRLGHLAANEDDGKFGDKTEAAVRSYQQAHAALSDDGVVGMNSLGMMDGELFSGSTGKNKADVDVQEYTGGQKKAAEQAVAVAYEMTDRAQKRMGGGGGELYKKWFDFSYDPADASSQARFRQVKHNWVKMHSVFKSMKIEVEHMDPGEVIRGHTYDSLYAYVKPADGKYHIWLGGAFWGAPLRGRDSRGGTVVHELSHEEAATDDHKYGSAKAELLARNDPDKAASNGDNWEFFAEDA